MSRKKEHDHVRRSIVKTLSWRVIATTTTIIIFWSLTGELALAASAGAIEIVLKLALYYGHERAWDRWNYGRD